MRLAWSEIVPPLWEGKISTESFTWRLQDALRDSERHWCRDCPLGQNPCQKAEESFNGWKRASGTMHTRKCMVPLGNLHGWTSQLAWFSSPKCMVQLLSLHGWTQKARFSHQKSRSLSVVKAPLAKIRDKVVWHNTASLNGVPRSTPSSCYLREGGMYSPKTVRTKIPHRPAHIPRAANRLASRL